MSTFAPATFGVKEHPARMLEEAQASMANWSEQLRFIDQLLASPLVAAADKMTLRVERKMATCCLLACANVVAACEKEMRKQRIDLEQKWGWLL